MATKISGYIRDEILTFTGLKKRGFFVPYKYAASVPRMVDKYAEVEAHFDKTGDRTQQFIRAIAANIPVFRQFGQQELDPSWRGGMFPPLDGAAAYTAVQLNKPKQIIEIGSGSSTRFLVRAAKDLGGHTKITCIDPAPRRSIEELGVHFERRVLSVPDLPLFDKLERNDIMFVDSSHLMMQGMDLDIILNRILPRLKSGVVIHFHDIFLPNGYPEHWERRHYSEQNALIGWILSDYLQVEYPGHYAASRYRDLIAKEFAGFPPFESSRRGSLWIRRS